jgi:hypothetical protein
VSVGKLVGMEWKLSIATASSSCSSLMSPYVALLLTVANADGKQKTVPLEMTLPGEGIGLCAQRNESMVYVGLS